MVFGLLGSGLYSGWHLKSFFNKTGGREVITWKIEKNNFDKTGKAFKTSSIVS
mgnify:FL=1